MEGSSKKERILTAARILGEGGLLASQLESIAQAHDVKLVDKPKKSEIKDALEVALTKAKADAIASDIIAALKEKKDKKKKQQKKKIAVSRESSEIIDGELADWYAQTGKVEVEVIQEDTPRIDEEWRSQTDDVPVEVVHQEEKKPRKAKRTKKDKKKTTVRSRTNSLSAGQLGDALGVDPVTRYVFSAAPRKNMINALDGGPIDNTPGSEGDEPAWLELPESMIVFGTDYQIPDSLTRDASLLAMPVYYVLRPEGLVYGIRPDQKLPCRGASVTKEPVRLLDLTNPVRAAGTLTTAAREIARILEEKGDVPTNLANETQILVRNENDRVKLAGLIEKLVALADAPDLLLSPSASQWGVSLSSFVVAILADLGVDGAAFTVYIGPARRPLQIMALTREASTGKLELPSPGTEFARCAKANDWLAKYDSNSVDGSLIGAWKAINLCPSGQCVKTQQVALRDGTEVQIAVVPSLTPLFSSDTATDEAFKSGSGVVPMWFDPTAAIAYEPNIKSAAELYRERAAAEEARTTATVHQALKQNPKTEKLVGSPAKPQKPTTASSDNEHFASLTKRPLALLDLRIPYGVEPERVIVERKRVVDTLSALSGHLQEPFRTMLADRLINATGSITNPAELANITRIIASALPNQFPKMARVPNGWIATLQRKIATSDHLPLPDNEAIFERVDTEKIESVDVVFLLDAEAAGWQVRNWLAAQDSGSDLGGLLVHRMTEAEKKAVMSDAGVGSIEVVKQKLSARQLVSIGDKLDQLIPEARIVGQQAPDLLWNGLLASYRRPGSHFPTFEVSVASVEAPVPIDIATVPAGAFMLFGTFGGSTDASPVRCYEAGLVPIHPRGGSFLATDTTKRPFQWAYAKTIGNLRMVELNIVTVNSLMTMIKDMDGSPDYALSSDDRAAFERLARAASTIPNSEFATFATALIAQGQANAYASNKGDECLEGRDLVVLEDAYLARRVNAGYGLVERVLSAVSRYFGIGLDGWFISKPLEYASPASSVLFGLLDRSVLYNKFMPLGVRAPGSGSEITWKIVRQPAGYSVPKEIRGAKNW